MTKVSKSILPCRCCGLDSLSGGRLCGVKCHHDFVPPAEGFFILQAAPETMPLSKGTFEAAVPVHCLNFSLVDRVISPGSVHRQLPIQVSATCEAEPGAYLDREANVRRDTLDRNSSPLRSSSTGSKGYQRKGCLLRPLLTARTSQHDSCLFLS